MHIQKLSPQNPTKNPNFLVGLSQEFTPQSCKKKKKRKNERRHFLKPSKNVNIFKVIDFSDLSRYVHIPNFKGNN